MDGPKQSITKPPKMQGATIVLQIVHFTIPGITKMWNYTSGWNRLPGVSSCIGMNLFWHVCILWLAQHLGHAEGKFLNCWCAEWNQIQSYPSWCCSVLFPFGWGSSLALLGLRCKCTWHRRYKHTLPWFLIRIGFCFAGQRNKGLKVRTTMQTRKWQTNTCCYGAVWI